MPARRSPRGHLVCCGKGAHTEAMDHNSLLTRICQNKRFYSAPSDRVAKYEGTKDSKVCF